MGLAGPSRSVSKMSGLTSARSSAAWNAAYYCNFCGLNLNKEFVSQGRELRSAPCSHQGQDKDTGVGKTLGGFLPDSAWKISNMIDALLRPSCCCLYLRFFADSGIGYFFNIPAESSSQLCPAPAASGS